MINCMIQAIISSHRIFCSVQKDKKDRAAELTATSAYIGEPDDNKWWKDVPDTLSFPEGPLQIFQPEILYHSRLQIGNVPPRNWKKGQELTFSKDRYDADRRKQNVEIYNKLLAKTSTFRFQKPQYVHYTIRFRFNFNRN